MVIPPHFQRKVHKEEWACRKLEGYALPLANDYCLDFVASRKDCWMKESKAGFLSSSCLWQFKCGRMPKSWLSKWFSDNHWGAQSAATGTIIKFFFYSSEQQLPLYTFSGQLCKSEEHKLHFMKAEKEVISRECKCRGNIWEYEEKEITHAHDSLTSSHTGYLPRMTYSLKTWRFYSHLFHQRGCLWLNLIPTGHNTNLHNAAGYCMSGYPQHKPKLVIWTAKVFSKNSK